MLARNQKQFPQNLYAAIRALCRVGALGKLSMMVVYAFRDDFDRIDSGV